MVTKAGQMVARSRLAVIALIGAAALLPQTAQADTGPRAPDAAAASANTDGPVMRVTQCKDDDNARTRDVSQVKVAYFETRSDAILDDAELKERKCDVKYLDAKTGEEQAIVFDAPVRFTPQNDHQADRAPSMIGFNTINTMAYDMKNGIMSDMALEANISPFKGRGLLSRTFAAARVDMLNGKIGFGVGAGVTVLNDSVSIQGGYVKAPLGGNAQINRMLGGATDTGYYGQVDGITSVGKFELSGQMRAVFTQNARQVSAFGGASYGPVTVKVNYTDGKADSLSRGSYDARYQGYGGGAYLRVGSALGMDLSAGPEYQNDRATLTLAARPDFNHTQRLSGPGFALRLSDKEGGEYRLFGRALQGEDAFGRKDSRMMFGIVMGGATASNPRVVTATSFDDKSYRSARAVEYQRVMRRGQVIVCSPDETVDCPAEEIKTADVAQSAYNPLPAGVAGPVITAQQQPASYSYRPR